MNKFFIGYILGVIFATILTVFLINISETQELDDLSNESYNYDKSLDKLFYAIWMVESSGRLNPPDGDNGKSIGPFQITESYWIDANMPYGEYQDCHNLKYSMKVMERYWNRYVPQALKDANFEVLARTHVGGPKGYSKSSTLIYWSNIKEYLK